MLSVLHRRHRHLVTTMGPVKQLQQRDLLMMKKKIQMEMSLSWHPLGSAHVVVRGV